MKTKLITDLQDSSNGFLDSAATDWVYANFSPASAGIGGNAPVEIPETPALTSEAAQSSGAQSGPASSYSLTSGGITINLLFDAAAMAAPASFRAGIQQAASILTASISDKITVNIKIDYSGVGGGAAAGPDNGLYESYSLVRSDLINSETPGDTTFNALPSGSSIQGQSNVAVWNAQLKLFGLLGANDTTTDDGSATFATDINSNLLVGVALHELTHAMGRVPYGAPYSSSPDIFDLFRFTSPGTRLINGGNTAPAAYFSLDGGNTKLADFGQNSDPSDFLNSGVQGGNDPFNEYYTNSTSQVLTAVDKLQLDALGFHVGSRSIVVAATTSQALQGGAAITLLSGSPTITDTASTTLSSATIKIANAGGSAVTGDLLFVNGVQGGSVGNGVTASWNVSTGTLTLTGSATLAVYDTLLSEVSYQDTGTDSSTGSHPLRTVTWAVNDGTANFNTTSQITIDRAPVTTAANVALSTDYTPVAASSLLTASDPDGDAIATYAFKDTGNGHFFLNGVAQANNQEIDVTAAQLAQLTYQSSGGADSLQVRVSDGTLWSTWQSFTVTGPTSTVIESFGSTSLVQVGSDYFLNPVAGGTGPELFYTGAPVTAGMWAGWAPVGAEQTSSGYDVAFKNASTGLFNIWSTDSNGNYTAGLASGLSGTSSALESYETIFHQDLNGDGTIGVPTSSSSSSPVSGTVIEAFGSTSLVQVGSDYFLNPVAGGTGPELFYTGAPVTAGMWAGWAPVGAEQTSSGYDVAFKNASTGLFNIWSTDSNGNYTAGLASGLSGTSSALESYETIFHQDLNGDGTIGVPTSSSPVSGTVIEAFGSTSLVQVGSDYFLNPVAGGTGPELFYTGAPVTAGMWAGWAPVGAEQTSSGYDVAFKNASTGLFNIWSTDSNGNYTAGLASGLSGTSSALESYETIFHQDLNGDGVIGVASPTSPLAGTEGLAIGAGATLELATGGSGTVAFNSPTGTLILDHASTFSGQIIGFAGDGTLAGSDHIDLRGMNYSTVYSGYDSSAGVLEVSDGTTTVDLKFAGTYSQANFKFADDGSGGTTVYDPPAPSQNVNSVPTLTSDIQSGPVPQADSVINDTFIFHPGTGAAVVVSTGSANKIELDGFSSVTGNAQLLALLNDAQTGQSQALFQSTNGGHDTVINLGNHDSITLINVAISDLHAGNFIIH